MARNDIPVSISDNTIQIPLTIAESLIRSQAGADTGSPYYVGARAYVTQTEEGAVITIVDKDGTTTATVLNGTNGVGIVSIEKTATSGLVDTYTITFSDGSTTTYDVTNGADAEIEALTNEEIEALLS